MQPKQGEEKKKKPLLCDKWQEGGKIGKEKVGFDFGVVRIKVGYL